MSLVTFDFVGCGLSDGFYVSLGWYEHLDLIELINDLKIRK